MAINYTNLWTDVGVFVRTSDLFYDFARSQGASVPNLNAELNAIQARLESQDLQRITEGLEPLFDTYRNTASSQASDMANRIQRRFLDQLTVTSQLPGADASDISRTLREIWFDMVAQSQTLNASTVLPGTPSFVGTGNGGFKSTIILDGVSPPSPGIEPFIGWRGENSALAVPSETMSFTCTADSASDGVPEGEEIFLAEGEPTSNGPFGWRPEGSGVSLQMSTVSAFPSLANKDFEAWNNNQPTNWTIESGTAGVEVLQENQLSEVYRGTSALKLVGTGTNVRLVQEIPAGLLVPDQYWGFCGHVKGTGVVGGTLTLRIESPSGGYVAAPTEEVVVTSFVPTYNHETFTIMIPKTLPEDLRFVIRFEGATAGEVWLDSFALAPWTYVNGIGVSIHPGTTSFVRGDRFTVAVTNTEGIFQRMMRRRFGFQMPQSGTPTIPDSLAQ